MKKCAANFSISNQSNVKKYFFYPTKRRKEIMYLLAYVYMYYQLMFVCLAVSLCYYRDKKVPIFMVFVSIDLFSWDSSVIRIKYDDTRNVYCDAEKINFILRQMLIRGYRYLNYVFENNFQISYTIVHNGYISYKE